MDKDSGSEALVEHVADVVEVEDEEKIIVRLVARISELEEKLYAKEVAEGAVGAGGAAACGCQALVWLSESDCTHCGSLSPTNLYQGRKMKASSTSSQNCCR
jgi:hypothetical protein